VSAEKTTDTASEPLWMVCRAGGDLMVRWEIRISILSRGVDELFAVKRSEAIPVVAAKDLLADVCRRHPGEDLRCPLMISLDDAVKKSEARKA
jgi:hypothetical protein